MRVFTGGVLGYLLFAIPTYLLFRLRNTDLRAPASISFEIWAVIFGMLLALLAGYIASLAGGRRHLVAAWIVGALIAIAAIVPIIFFGVVWWHVAMVIFMAPAAVLGGWAYMLRRRAQNT